MERPLREGKKAGLFRNFLESIYWSVKYSYRFCWYLVVSTLTIQKQCLSPYFHNTKYNIFEAIWKIEGTTRSPGDGEAGKEITQSLDSLLS